MAEDRVEPRVEAVARALRKLEPDDEGQSWREHYILKVPSGEGWREYVPMARAALAAADAVSGAEGWHRGKSDPGFIYSLCQVGWRKGEPLLVNDVMIRVEVRPGSNMDREALVQTILRALPPPPERGDG